MGLGPRHMNKGDHICILFGGPVPFLLRDAGLQHVEGCGYKRCHELIGDCYVQGIMDGEVTKKMVNGQEVDIEPEPIFLV